MHTEASDLADRLSASISENLVNIEMLGADSFERRSVEPYLRESTNAVNVSLGFDSACYLEKSHGSEGTNIRCQGPISSQFPPPRENFVAVSVGFEHICAINGLLAVICWGRGHNHRLDTPEDGKYTSITTGHSHSCALTEAGHPVCWGAPGGQRLLHPRNTIFFDISSGSHFTCGRRIPDKRILCWGQNQQGQTDAPSDAVDALDCGHQHCCAVKAVDHSVICWGRNIEGQVEAPEIGKFTSIAVGYKHSCAIDASAEIKCWGLGNLDQNSPPAGKFASISAGGHANCAVKFGEAKPTQGRYPEYPLQGYSTICWGMNKWNLPNGQIGDWLYFIGRDRHFQ